MISPPDIVCDGDMVTKESSDDRDIARVRDFQRDELVKNFQRDELVKKQIIIRYVMVISSCR